MATTTLEPPNSNLGPVAWVRQNLLSTWHTALLTVLSIIVLYFALRGLLTWLFFNADWSPVTSNLKLYLVGQYPAEEMWRVGVGVITISLLAGLSWGVWGGVARTMALAIAIGMGALALAPLDLDTLSIEARVWILANPASIVAGHFVGRSGIVQPRWLIIAWALSYFLGVALLRGFEGVPGLPVVGTGQWGGLLLTFILSTVGIVASFPLGVALALGRRSNLPVVKLFSVMFIEGVRGVPLITLLFMTQIILPLFLPEELRIDRVLRAFLAITLFSAAYTAENVRGGLQAVPLGQIEAAKALGLSGRHIMLYIVLPQALRAVIPAIVGQFISLFKDTSLVVIVGLLDIVGIGRSIVLGNVKWVGSQREVYVFIGAVYWVFTYSMSYASRRLETALGVGKR